jgi:hypothetical protein
MLMLTQAGELGFARAVHEAIGKLLMGAAVKMQSAGRRAQGLAFRADIR